MAFDVVLRGTATVTYEHHWGCDAGRSRRAPFARLVAMELRSRAESVSSSMTAIGVAVRGAGNTFEVEDAALAQTFESLQFEPRRN